MKMYWRCKDVPELAELSRSERRKVVRNCFFNFGFRLWEFWIGQAAIFICGFLGMMVGVVLEYVFGFPYIVDFACRLIGVLIGCSIYTWIYCGVILEKLRPHFRDYLQSHKV